MSQNNIISIAALLLALASCVFSFIVYESGAPAHSQTSGTATDQQPSSVTSVALTSTGVAGTISTKQVNSADIEPADGSALTHVLLTGEVKIYTQGAAKDPAAFAKENKAYQDNLSKLATENKDRNIPPPTPFVLNPASATDITVGASVVIISDNIQVSKRVISSGELIILSR